MSHAFQFHMLLQASSKIFISKFLTKIWALDLACILLEKGDNKLQYLPLFT